MTYLVDLLQQCLFCQLLSLKFAACHLQLHDVQIDDLFNLAVVLHRVGQHVVIEILKELDPFIVDLVEVLFELLVVSSKFCAQLPFFILYPHVLKQSFVVRVLLLLHAAVVSPPPEDHVLLEPRSRAF